MAQNPTIGMARCCARAASGHAAAPPSRVVNSRRRMVSLQPQKTDIRAAEIWHSGSGQARPSSTVNNGSSQPSLDHLVGRNGAADRAPGRRYEAYGQQGLSATERPDRSLARPERVSSRNIGPRDHHKDEQGRIDEDPNAV